MISSIRFTGGYASRVRTLKKTLSFAPGINVLFGPNGSGKSTVIGTLAKYGLTRGGWTTWDWCMMMYLFNDKKPTLEDYLDEYPKNKCTAEVDIDAPVFLGNEAFYDGSGIAIARSGLGNGAIDMYTAMGIQATPYSAGQARRAHINSMVERVCSTGCETDNRPDPSDAVRTMLYEHIRDHLSGNTPTILLDEPDRHLDLTSTAFLYNEMLPAVAKQTGMQVIVATHSPIVLARKDFRIVDMRKGYSAECRRIFKNMFKEAK